MGPHHVHPLAKMQTTGTEDLGIGVHLVEETWIHIFQLMVVKMVHGGETTAYHHEMIGSHRGTTVYRHEMTDSLQGMIAGDAAVEMIGGTIVTAEHTAVVDPQACGTGKGQTVTYIDVRNLKSRIGLAFNTFVLGHMSDGYK